MAFVFTVFRYWIFLGDLPVILDHFRFTLIVLTTSYGDGDFPYEKKLYGTYMSKLYVKYRGHIIVKYMSHICILNVNEVEDI